MVTKANLSVEALTPSASVLCKLGSLCVHVEEMLSPDGHDFDKVAIESLIRDPELRGWLRQMDALGMVPVKRG